MPMVTIACPRAGQIKGVGQNLLEFLLVGNDVIGGQHGHDAGGGARADQRRAQRDGGAGVAAHRLGDEIGLGEFRQLFAHFRQLRLVGDDENIFGRHQRQHAVHGLLQKRTFAEQREQLLGHLLAAQRPEPLAAPARHDDDETVFGVGFGFHQSAGLAQLHFQMITGYFLEENSCRQFGSTEFCRLPRTE